ncbi:hypothetical protein MUK42_16144 [Musa troglodytarum]|uniref:Uncharacterized protein n=1 Tax=Musa troglodytarum TaxID=320322 RepID=A0A9E7GN37_9LILI|nr:hypothetical protein MUK42_16144 [Musa troglodytarum]
MQRATAIVSLALRRLAATEAARPMVVARAASLAGPAVSRRLCCSLDLHRPIARLLPPVYKPSRSFARGRELIPSDFEEEDSDEEEDFDEDLDDLDEGFDGETDIDEDWSEFDGNDSRDESEPMGCGIRKNR